MPQLKSQETSHNSSQTEDQGSYHRGTTSLYWSNSLFHCWYAFPLLICFFSIFKRHLPQFVKFVKFLFYGTIKYLSCSHLKVKSEREKDNRCLLIGLMYTRFWNYTPTSKEHLSADNNLCNSTKMTNSRRLGRWIIPVTDCKVNRLKLSRYILHFPINQKVSFFFFFFFKM